MVIYVTESWKMVPNHMKSNVFHHIFDISTDAFVFIEYLLLNFNNLIIKFHVML